MFSFPKRKIIYKLKSSKIQLRNHPQSHVILSCCGLTGLMNPLTAYMYMHLHVCRSRVESGRLSVRLTGIRQLWLELEKSESFAEVASVARRRWAPSGMAELGVDDFSSLSLRLTVVRPLTSASAACCCSARFCSRSADMPLVALGLTSVRGLYPIWCLSDDIFIITWRLSAGKLASIAALRASCDWQPPMMIGYVSASMQ
jgi:hypothetical protein